MISAPVTFLLMDVKTAHVPSGAKVKLFERSEAKNVRRLSGSNKTTNLRRQTSLKVSEYFAALVFLVSSWFYLNRIS